ncbi:MAG: putative peptide-modifying radical SAM/SPASM domain-containing protein, partial [Candidatus Odinarchaeia archaeon]
NITLTNPNTLLNSCPLTTPCTNCEINWICGGRCWFANKTKLWGEKWFKTICKTVFHLVHLIKSNLPIIKKLIQNQIISESQFNYPIINNGCEIIP